MKRKAVGIVLFCLVLLAAIVAGYWDMLTAEKLRVVRNKASDAVGEIAAIVRTDETARPPAEPPPPQAPPAAPAAQVPAAPQVTGAAPASAPSATSPPTPPAAPDAPKTSEAGTRAGAEASSPPAPVDAPADTAAAPEAQGEPGPVDISVEAPVAAAPLPVTPADTAQEPAATSDASAPLPPQPAPQTPLDPPSFDILRVEPDGSTVLAGRAPAGAVVTLREGAGILGSATATADGAFVILVPEALSIGNHQMRIEAQAVDGRRATSLETAVVSIPEKGREGELLAMVETPDQASRLISIPSATPETPAAVPTPAQDPVPIPDPNPSAAASEPSAGAPQDPVAGRPAASAATAGSDVAAPALAPALAVEAVEIEDDTIYVAGRASGGVSVRVYIDNDFLAEDRGLADERFLVTARNAVPTGEHTVRADALDASGAVVARVEVPFLKPEGRTMAAISSAEPPPEAPGAPEATPAPLTSADAALEDEATASPPAVGAPRDADLSTASGGSEASDAAPDPADGELPAASVPLAVQRLDGPPPSSAAESPAAAAGVNAPALAEDETISDRIAAADLPAPAVFSSDAPTLLDPARIASDAAETAAVPPPPAAPPLAPAAPSPAIDAPAIAVTRQPALEPAPSRVIIRRGDTLWRISRETYGLGRRYTVIYLANGDQIRDPDRIYPGQVFRVPEDEAGGTETPPPPG